MRWNRVNFIALLDCERSFSTIPSAKSKSFFTILPISAISQFSQTNDNHHACSLVVDLNFHKHNNLAILYITNHSLYQIDSHTLSLALILYTVRNQNHVCNYDQAAATTKSTPIPGLNGSLLPLVNVFNCLIASFDINT